MGAVKAVLLLATGLVAGTVGGLLGIGGCSIMLPVLIFIYHYSEPVAIGTTITAVILTAASGAIAHIRMRNIDRETALIVGASGALGAVIGDILFNILSKKIAALDLVLGLAFIYTALRMTWEGLKGARLSVSPAVRQAVTAQAKTGSPDPATPQAPDSLGGRVPGSTAAKAAIGFVVGIVSGIVGLGGGYILVPAFIYLLGSPVKIAVGTSLASFLPLAVVSAAPKLAAGQADAAAAIALGIGTIAGAQIGAKLVPKVPSWLIKLLFGLIFLAVSLKFIWKGLAGIH